MNNELITKLSKLTLQYKYLKKELDLVWYNKAKRKQIFDKMKSVNKEIEYVKFKLRLERKIKNENNNSN